MNRRLFIAGCVLLLFASLCRDNHQKPRESSLTETSVPEQDLFTDTLRLDSLLDRLGRIQQGIISGKKDAAKRLLHEAYDTVAGCFFVVGRAPVRLDSSGDTSLSRMRLTAKNDAFQWAFFCKQQRSGSHVADIATPKGKILYSRQLLERSENDTLNLLFMIPAGSIIIP